MAVFFSVCSPWYLLICEPQLVLHDWHSPVPHRVHLCHAVAPLLCGANFPHCVFAMHLSVSLVHLTSFLTCSTRAEAMHYGTVGNVPLAMGTFSHLALCCLFMWGACLRPTTDISFTAGKVVIWLWMCGVTVGQRLVFFFLPFISC